MATTGMFVICIWMLAAFGHYGAATAVFLTVLYLILD